MSTIEMSSTAPEEEQQGSTTVLADISTPINFAETTAADFGISVQSFIPASLPSSNRKEKSRLAELKARRRSNIGVRGSPETNSLIRFIAQQRMNIPPAQATPELVRQSPFLPRVASTLRQKMACFQSLMGVEESGDSSSRGCITTRDDLCDCKNLEAGKENHPPSMALPPNKKRRLGLSHGCEDKITEGSHPPLLFNLKQLEEEDSSVKHKPLQSDNSEGASAQALVISPPFTEGERPGSPGTQLWPPVENQQEVVFELERIHQPRPDDPSAVSAERPVSHFPSPSISTLLDMKPPADSFSSPTLRKKKKQVHFGEPLHPELFDKTLPPSTPLQKGGTPARAPTPGGALKLRSLLKTPQRSDSPSTWAQLELSSPSVFASPTLSMPRSRRTAASEDDREELSGMIPFPMEEIENEAAIAEESLNAQLLNLNTAFNEDTISHSESECETKAVKTFSSMDSLPHEPLQEKEPQTDIAAPACGTSSSSRRKGGKASHDTTEAPTRSGGRKRKLPEESEPVKRSSRSAAKTASGKMKESTATRRWNKKVDRSLYGSRAYASKNPSLSPITEQLSLGLSFSTEEPPALHHTAPSPAPHPDLRCNGKSVSGDLATVMVPQTGDTTALNTSTTPQVSLSLPVADKKNSAQRTRRRPGSKGTGRALKGRKVSVNDDQADARVHDRSEESYAKQEETEETKRTETVINSTGDAGSDISATNLDAPTAMNEKSKSPAILEASLGFSAGEEFKHALGEVEPGQENEPVDKMNHEVEREQGDQTLSQRETTRLRSDEHEEEEAPAASALSLPPWQDDFNFEDVFKPVPTRGQRSVRRSLRNQSSADHSSSGGLAWVPRISPEPTKESRRRTRGRRHSAALPAPALEVTQP